MKAGPADEYVVAAWWLAMLVPWSWLETMSQPYQTGVRSPSAPMPEIGTPPPVPPVYKMFGNRMGTLPLEGAALASWAKQRRCIFATVVSVSSTYVSPGATAPCASGIELVVAAAVFRKVQGVTRYRP